MMDKKDLILKEINDINVEIKKIMILNEDIKKQAKQEVFDDLEKSNCIYDIYDKRYLELKKKHEVD